jgi:hypothetical protein
LEAGENEMTTEEVLVRVFFEMSPIWIPVLLVLLVAWIWETTEAHRDR